MLAAIKLKTITFTIHVHILSILWLPKYAPQEPQKCAVSLLLSQRYGKQAKMTHPPRQRTMAIRFVAPPLLLSVSVGPTRLQKGQCTALDSLPNITPAAFISWAIQDYVAQICILFCRYPLLKSLSSR